MACMSPYIIALHVKIMYNAYIPYPHIQTWDLLRVMYNGFIGLCTSFLAENSNYFIIPVRVNGSAVESYFSQLKFTAGGQLSSANYATAQASVETTKAAAIKRPREADYRDAGLHGYTSCSTKKTIKPRNDLLKVMCIGQSIITLHIV